MTFSGDIPFNSDTLQQYYVPIALIAKSAAR
jgi:hypothetical protein